MIELWSAPTPDGQQVQLLLEETGLPYKIMPDDTGDAPHRRPAIRYPSNSQTAIELSEAAAILIYLAEKAGNFIPPDPAGRLLCLQWLMFQAPVGGAFQYYQQFSKAGSEHFAVIEAFRQEMRRLTAILETRLAEDDYLAGTYSIADIANYPVIAAAAQVIDLDRFPATRRWADRLASRPAVARGISSLG